MIEALSDLINTAAPVADPLALFLVVLIAWRKPSIVAAIIVLDFALTYIGYKWASSRPFWERIAEDYNFLLAAKDLLVAYILIKANAKPSLVFVYGVASVLSWSVWFSIQLLNSYRLGYEPFSVIYYGSVPAYFVIMWAEVLLLWRGGYNGGKRIRPPVPVRRHRAYGMEPSIDDRYYTPPSQKMG